jgi:hypothetical protein
MMRDAAALADGIAELRLEMIRHDAIGPYERCIDGLLWLADELADRAAETAAARLLDAEEDAP